ncbi:hypothetical protein MMC16_005402 [Acarospora aff. strigata]|nr:hypothetical protein [Acarospora aff. strigata]
MTQPGASGMQNGGGYGSASEIAQRGARRRKLAGYLKAANELRQSYQQSYVTRGQHDPEGAGDEAGIPGAFPDVAIVRHGDEEMVLFPSYARRHIKKEHRRPSKDPRETSGAAQQIRDDSGTGTGDAEFWRKEWEKYEDDNAVVDVDVRGWMYSPHRGPISRKNRLLIGLARHLSGIPAPSSSSRNTSRASSPNSSHRERPEARAARHEEALVEKEAENITKRGEGEADVAARGGYSEDTTQSWDKASIYSVPEHSRPPSPDKSKEPNPGQFPHSLTNSSLQSVSDDAPGPGFLKKRASWNQPADMSPEELSIANAHLMARLKPFLTDPLASTPLTVFFYNDQTSQSRTIVTNEAGHFTLRAALDFVPSHVRVLASENLSATEEVLISEPTGISLISDIDDTIKHSAIGSGAKETFRNVFIRELADLAIEGVKEWYTKLAEMGVKLHYVSNSPWQLYPVLVSYFALAGLPPGSFHLKQYSGMLQGIFEPVAERKKGTLERILHDFPERSFILVGDSGEADLELYTDVVIANPGRILGVFIRDVTTPSGQGFFDGAMGPLNGDKSSSSSLRGRGRNGHSALSPTTEGTKPERKPIVPPRRGSTRALSQEQHTGKATGTLIDLSEDTETQQISPRATTNRKVSGGDKKSPRPVRPSKPMALRSASGSTKHGVKSSKSKDSSPPRKGPLPPPKPRTLSMTQDSAQSTSHSSSSQTQNAPAPGSRATSLERRTYTSAVRNKVASAYNSIPSPTSYWYGTGTSQNPPSSGSDHHQHRPSAGSIRTLSTSGVSTKSQTPPAPPTPPRRHLTSYPAAAAHYASNRISGGWSSGGGANGSESSTGGGGSGGGAGGGGDDVNGNPTQPVNKKLELWKRRWARAKEILDGKGVMLRSWRVGTDVMDDAVGLVERAKKELNDGGGGKRNNM